MHKFKYDNDKGKPPFWVPFSEVIEHEDPGASKCDEVKQKIKGLLKRNTLQCYVKEEYHKMLS